MTIAVQALTFVAQLGASYLLGRIGAQDAPKLENLNAASGEYGVAIPRCFGGAARYTLPIIAMSDIKETEHEVQDYSEVVGAISGAAAGFLAAGPIGAIAGAVIGGLLGAGAPDQKYYTYSYPAVALLIADRTGDVPIEDLLKMWANGRVLFDPAELPAPVTTLDSNGNLLKRTWGENRYFEELTIYGGGNEQVADPLLEAEIGPQPGYRWRAYVVIKELQLEFFGNAFPSPVEGLVRAREGQSLGEFVDAVAASANIDVTRDLSSSELASTVLAGLAITEQKSCWDAIRPILPAYRMDVAEVAGQVRFHRRAQSWRASLTDDDLGAHQFGDSPPPRVTFTRSDPTQSPRATNLTFIDPGRDYQSNTAISQRSGGDSRSNVDITLALTLTADEAATAAATMHWDASLGIVGANFAVTDDWISLEPGRVYALPVDGVMLPYRVTQRLRGANGVSEIEARSDEDVVFKGQLRGSSGDAIVNESTLFAATVVVPIDMPMTTDGHDDFGFYIAMGAGAAYWTRGRAQVSSDGVNFATLIDSNQSAVMGDVTGTLAAGSTSGLDDTLDTATVLTVELLHDGMILQSATDAQLDANANFAFVGADGTGEYLQFKTATKTGPRTWQLTNLRRGRRGTDYAIPAHGAGEQFVLLGQGGVFRIVATDDTGWGDALTLRGVHLLETEGGQPEVSFANIGQAKRPYSPVNLAGAFDGAGDLNLTWSRRSRFDSGNLETDAPEAYEVDIYDDATFKRTLSVSSPAAMYLITDRTDDGFVPGDTITVQVFQVNAAFGRSRARTADFVVP
ncbi:phage tail protein [Erythrobacter sp. HA6-11]